MQQRWSGAAVLSRAAATRSLLPVVLSFVGLLATYRLTVSWASGRPVAPMLVLTAVLAGALVWRPRLVALAVIILGASVLRPPVAPFGVAGLRTDAQEVLAFALIGVWALTQFVHRDRHQPAFTGPLLALGAAVAAGIVRGLVGGADPYLVKGQGKTWFLYLLALPLLALFRTADRQDQLARWTVRICTACSGLTILGLATGHPVPNDTPNVALNTLGVTVEVDRVRPAFLSLLVVGFLLLLGRCLADRFTPVRIAQLCAFTVVEALSYNRATWVALAVAAAALLWLRPGARTSARGLRIALITVAMATTALLVSGSGALGTDAQAVVTRLESVGSPQLSRDASFEDRQSENRDAFRALRANPVTGVGVGALYGARRLYYRPDLQRDEYEDRPYLHNSLLYLYLQLGLPGLAVAGWLGLRVGREIRRWRMARDPIRGARGTAAGVAVGALALQSLANSYLLHRPSITALAVALALVAAPATDDKATDDAAAAS